MLSQTTLLGDAAWHTRGRSCFAGGLLGICGNDVEVAYAGGWLYAGRASICSSGSGGEHAFLFLDETS